MTDTPRHYDAGFQFTINVSRRQFLRATSCGFGSVALHAILQQQAGAEQNLQPTEASALATKQPLFVPRARRTIFLFMSGGPSQVDLYDYKPFLAKGSGGTLPYELPKTEATVGLENTRLLGPVSGFKHQGECGLYHNHHGFAMWMAGGGVKGGITHGATDDFGYHAINGRVHINDLHATILHLMGLDHEQLTFEHHGRPFRLTDVAGRVVKEILA